MFFGFLLLFIWFVPFFFKLLVFFRLRLVLSMSWNRNILFLLSSNLFIFFNLCCSSHGLLNFMRFFISVRQLFNRLFFSLLVFFLELSIFFVKYCCKLLGSILEVSHMFGFKCSSWCSSSLIFSFGLSLCNHWFSNWWRHRFRFFLSCQHSLSF